MRRFGDVFDNYMRIIHVRKRLTAFTAAYDQIASIIPYHRRRAVLFRRQDPARRAGAGRARLRPGQLVAEFLRHLLCRPRRLQGGARPSDLVRRGDRARPRRARPRPQASRTPPPTANSRSPTSTSTCPTAARWRASNRFAFVAARADPGRRPLGRRQIDPLARHRRNLAVRRGRDRRAAGEDHAAAAAPLHSDRPAARRHRLSRRRPPSSTTRRSARRLRQGRPRRASPTGSTTATIGRCVCRAASSSGSRSRARCSPRPTGCSSTKRPRRSTRRAKAALYHAIAAKLPKTTIVSIGHRSTLAAFHKRRVALTPRANAPAAILERDAGRMTAGATASAPAASRRAVP